MVVGGFTVMGIKMARAQSLSSPLGNTTPPELQKILERRPEGPIISGNTPSQKRFTIPSLWWTNQQFGEKLVLDWQAFGVNQAGSQQISVVVRPELWTRYTYFERYAFVLKFGTDASHFKYHLFVQDPQNLILGTYTCNFLEANSNVSANLFASHPMPDSMSHRAQSLSCRLWLNPNYPRTVF